MKILVTGGDGFLATNLRMHLNSKKNVELMTYNRGESITQLERDVKTADWIFHLAGINRSDDCEDFLQGNSYLTEQLCDSVLRSGRSVPIVFSSSIQVTKPTPYGKTKLAAENTLLDFEKSSNNPVFIYRLPNVFGKWSRPNHNSVVATFCYNVARELAVDVHDPDAQVRLVFVDDVIKSFLSLIENKDLRGRFVDISPEYKLTVGQLLKYLREFKSSRENLTIPATGEGLVRALHSTYLSFLPPEQFAYTVADHKDERGRFVEMIKTPNYGQVSFFTARPGVTRGGHFHHSKTEKFLIVKGTAKFRFKQILTGEKFELLVSDKDAKIVETIPGWAHDVTNISNEELICMIWANEIFDKNTPDTYMHSLNID